MTSVLAVEDEFLVRTILVEALADAGYTVLEAGDGEEALALLREGEPVDIVLTDIRMPRLDGFGLVKAAREIYPDLPVIFMTGYSGSSLHPDFINATVLGKPFTPEELIALVQRMIPD
jgi:two-component system cell cycle sensor histidine kinase/response regulator CckA